MSEDSEEDNIDCGCGCATFIIVCIVIMLFAKSCDDDKNKPTPGVIEWGGIKPAVDWLWDGGVTK